MGQEYRDEPSKTSGALYHSVITCVIKKGPEIERESDTSWVYWTDWYTTFITTLT